jgi:large conductance mechanosensitive channel
MDTIKKIIPGKAHTFAEEFKTFAFQGNLIDLAVGIVIGTAFNTIINSFVSDIIMPIVGTIFGKPDFSSLIWGTVKIGSFVTNIVNFVIIALSVFVALKVVMRWMPKKESTVQE